MTQGLAGPGPNASSFETVRSSKIPDGFESHTGILAGGIDAIRSLFDMQLASILGITTQLQEEADRHINSTGKISSAAIVAEKLSRSLHSAPSLRLALMSILRQMVCRSVWTFVVYTAAPNNCNCADHCPDHAKGS